MITGLNHITIAVKDLERSFQFYKEILEFKPLIRHSQGAYFLAGDFWFCMDLDSRTRAAPLPEYTHFAFSVSSENFENLSAQIKKSGAKIWKENVSEGDSLYFMDPDGHKLEIHVGSWKTRIESIMKRPWSDSIEYFNVSNSVDSSIVIRPAHDHEACFLSGLAVRSKSYWPYPPDYLEKCYNVLKVTSEDIRNWPVGVSELNGEIIGFFALKTVSDENRLDHLWIDPRFVGKGVGKSLFKEAVLAAKRIGWSQFRIASDPYAEPFYLKMGAKNVGSVQSNIRPNLLLPHMEIWFD
ncbi:MAG: GNAT family N-acetyltransferase [Bdellovibrionaceae bacterium]|nr:GNAT family N-acetyltransferase [Pseudobdellovibrionaceae bacterium]